MTQLSGLPLFTELPRRRVFSETRAQYLASLSNRIGAKRCFVP
jgi:hypothetical protein